MSDVEHNLRGAYSHYQAGNLDAAEKWILSILGPKPFHVGALHLGASIASARGDRALALSRLQNALTKTPKDPALLTTLGEVQALEMDFVRAERAYRAALDLAPELTPARYKLALMLLQDQQPDLARREFDRLVAMQPSEKKFAIGRVIALKDSLKLDEAQAALRAIDDSALAPGQAAHLMAQIAFARGDLDGVLHHAERSFGSDLYGAYGLSLAFQTLHMAGDKPAMTRLAARLDRALAGERMLAALARAQRLSGDLAAAEGTVLAALSTHSQSAELRMERAEIALARGEVKSAYQDAFDALSLRPGDLALMPIFARSALAAGEVQGAMVAAHEALKLRPYDQFWIAIKATAGRMSGQDYGFYFNYNKFVRSYELAAPDGYKTIADFNRALSLVLTDLHRSKAAPLDQTLRLGTQTRSDLRFADHPMIAKFFAALHAPIMDYMKAIGADLHHPLTRRNTGAYRLAGAWSVRLQKGGHHVNHVHPQGWISSSYYVDVPREVAKSKTKAGWIGFGGAPWPISGAQAEHFVQPTSGKLVLFPSYLWHGTVPLGGKDSRLTLPFDITPAAPEFV